MKRILLAVLCGMLAFLCACGGSPVVVVTPTPIQAETATPEIPSTTPVSTPDPTPTPAPTRITVMAVGDLLCLGAQLSAARDGGSYDFDYAFAEIKDVISSADLAIGNLETLIAKGYPYTAIASSATPTPAPTETEPVVSSTPPADSAGESSKADFAPRHDVQLWQQTLPVGPLVNGPDDYLSAVVDAGFDVLTTANNHMNDYGVDGLQKTIGRLDSYGIPHTGSYAKADDKAPLIVDIQGIRIGIVAYTDHLNTYSDLNESLFNLYDEDKMAADIAATEAAGADFIVFSMHWGVENTREVTQEQREIAQAAADAGADLILGSHPHCVQDFDLLETDHGSVPVIYSLGNFISSMARDINKDGMILKFVLEKNNVTGETTLGAMSYIPTICTTYDDKRFVVLPADTASAEGSSTRQGSRDRTIEALGTDIATPE